MHILSPETEKDRWQDEEAKPNTILDYYPGSNSLQLIVFLIKEIKLIKISQINCLGVKYTKNLCNFQAL